MLTAKNLCKNYESSGNTVQVLKSVSLDIASAEFVSIVGRSGSGKTTLLNVLSTLLKPDSGDLVYNNQNITQMKDSQLKGLRQRDFAVIFQFHYLLPYLTALENTLLPFMQGIRPVSGEDTRHAKRCLERVGLSGKENRLPGNLSGGEQQRVAIARALVKKSKLLFADEPTGSLDKATGESIMKLLRELNEDGIGVVMVTHDPQYAGYAKRTIEMEDGRILN